ncbi:nucleotidyltransferase domain-containing protein [Burkholderia contaminans]|uniref:nucleotidyltransferase domain-containing protein n=1 Tax=Burkholderia contaminans TaxID=488447 RepID=UPI003D666F00
MTTHFYAFGSICRGEVDRGSDVDLLACVSSTPQSEIDPKKFSIYTYDRLRDLWAEGNPFAWHLHLESRLLFSSDSTDFIALLGKPAEYQNASRDCSKFLRLFRESRESLLTSENSEIFHLSCIFLSIRNFATCSSFLKGRPIFSRKSPLLVDPPLPISEEQFDIFARARILSTRGYGLTLSSNDLLIAKKCLSDIDGWMNYFQIASEK